MFAHAASPMRIHAILARLDAAEADARRWRFSIADGGNQSMNFMDVYSDWDGECSFVDAIDAALTKGS
jgi:hypothetical protein